AFALPRVGLWRGAGHVTSELDDLDIRIGYSSAAAGPDIEFLEAVRARGGRTHVVLPCREEQFIEESVPDEWLPRFRGALASADEVLIASEERLKSGSIAYDYADELLQGLAAVRAAQLDTELIALGRPRPRPPADADEFASQT